MALSKTFIEDIAAAAGIPVAMLTGYRDSENPELAHYYRVIEQWHKDYMEPIANRVKLQLHRIEMAHNRSMMARARRIHRRWRRPQ